MDTSKLLDTIRELLQVAGWHQSLYADIHTVAPEYFARHPDLNAVFYLETEAGAIQQRAQVVLIEAEERLKNYLKERDRL